MNHLALSFIKKVINSDSVPKGFDLGFLGGGVGGSTFLSIL